MKQFLRLWLPVFLWAGLIYYLSDQPDLRIVHDNALDLILRKTAHMFVFGTLYMLLWRALGKKMMWLALLLTIGYAATDELHQTHVFGRHGSPTDILFDTAGILVAIVLWKLFQKIRTKPNN